ncbi:unnamed protein product, partial [Rotaria sp. Silwood2]
ITTTQHTTTTDLPITSALFVRIKSKIQSTNLTIESPTTYINTYETTSNIEYIPTTTTNDLIVL